MIRKLKTGRHRLSARKKNANQTSSRQHGARGVEPRLASGAGAIAGTTRRSDCSDIPRAGSGDTLPEQLQRHILVALQW
jgi:hypothetical protein